jgi:disulfide bond formation protein DsbB
MTLPKIDKLVPLIVLGVCAGALAMAFVAQYVFGLEPCNLCILQRIPYASAGVLAAIALAAPLPPRVRVALVALCGFVFLAGSAIALYHVGVEQGWWASSCLGEPPTALSLQDMLAQAQLKQQRPCDLVNWTFLGISMATYNVPFSLGMALFSWIGARRMAKV